MEQLYRKVGKRYIEWGFGGIPDISDGIWLVQNNPHSKSQTSLLWKVGDLKRPCDIVTHASLQAMEDDLSKYLLKLGDINSYEYKEAKEICRELNGAIICTNVSACEMATLILRQIAIKCEKI